MEKIPLKTNFVNTLKSIFIYKPTESYSFTLPESQEEQGKNNSTEEHTGSIPTENLIKEKTQKIYSSINVNIEYLKVKYNTLINSDIVIREFSLMAKGKEYKAFLLYVDGMINSNMINDFVLKPLMLRNKANTYPEDDDSTIIAVSR